MDAKAYIEGEDKDALVVPFRGRVREQENTTTLLDSAELSGVDAIVEKTLEDCQIGYFFTANENLVAAWAFNVSDYTGLRLKYLEISRVICFGKLIHSRLHFLSKDKFVMQCIPTLLCHGRLKFGLCRYFQKKTLTSLPRVL